MMFGLPSSKWLPKSLWDNEVLRLPQAIEFSHRSFLEEKGWLGSYKPELSGGVGGSSSADATEHVINRFLNSAARMQYVCLDPREEQPEIREMIFDQLGDGDIFVLDLAAGNGAGTISILSLLGVLRVENVLPKFPLNLHVYAVDFSPDALSCYAELLGKAESWLEAGGVKVELTLMVCDLTVGAEFNEVLEIFLGAAAKSGVSRFMTVVSAISGAGQEGVAKMHDSFKIAAAALGHSKRSTTWLWVEPSVGKTWLTKLVDSVRLVLKKVPHLLSKKGDSYDVHADVTLLANPEARRFEWFDPYKKTNAKSHVVVMAFSNK